MDTGAWVLVLQEEWQCISGEKCGETNWKDVPVETENASQA